MSPFLKYHLQAVNKVYKVTLDDIRNYRKQRGSFSNCNTSTFQLGHMKSMNYMILTMTYRVYEAFSFREL